MNETLLLIPILIPILFGVVLYLLPELSEKTMRILIGIVVLVNSAITWVWILRCGSDGVVLFSFTEKLTFCLRFDGFGRFFAGLVAALWPFTTAYAYEYMVHEERKQTFFAFFTMSFGVTLGIAMSGNLLTMYCFYELLTLVTVPLVIHTMTKEAVRATRLYLVFSVGGAAFAFAAMMFLIANSAGGWFTLGGLLEAYPDSGKNLTLLLYVIGFLGFGVKAAVFPMDAWLPRASVAPTPVTALLHAVAVVKSGVFAITRLTFYCFGTELLIGTWAQYLVMAFAIFTIFYGSSRALKEAHFKRRLAYSTVSNLSYIIFGVTLMTSAGFAAGLMHMLFHAIAKILSFFCAGAVLHGSKREYLHELDGLGWKMPVTFLTFTVSAAALTGVPLFNGFVSKWNLITAAVSTHNPMGYVGIAVLLISALLTAMYMFNVVIRAYFPRRDKDLSALEGQRDVNGWMLVPMSILAVCCIVTGVYAQPIFELATAIATGLY